MSSKFNASNLSKFGRVALDLQFVDIRKLEECLNIQFRFEKAGKEVPKLGQILMAKKYITADQLKTILEKQKDSKYTNATESSTDLLQQIPQGTVIYRQNTSNDANLYLLHEGIIEILQGDYVIETISKKGEFFGIIPFLINTPYTESARAGTDCKVFCIPGHDVNKFLQSKPEMALRIAKILAHKIYDNAKDSVTEINDNNQETSIAQEIPVAAELEEENLIPEPEDIPEDDIFKAEPENEQTPVPVDSSDILPLPEGISDEFLQLINACRHTPAIIYQQEDISDFISGIDSIPPLKYSKEITNAVKNLIQIYLSIEKLDKERTAIFDSFDVVPDNIKNEINKQRREITRISPLDSLVVITAKIREKLNPPLPENTEESVAPAPMDKNIRKLLEISIMQKELLIQRYKILPEIIKICAGAAQHEPLFILLQKYNIDPTVLFGWGVYAMAVKEYNTVQIDKLKTVRSKISDFDNKSGNSFGKILLKNKKSSEQEEELSNLREAEEMHRLIQLNSNRELKNIEKDMVDEFWKVYKAAARLLLTEIITGTEKVILKAFLRTGLLGHTSRWISFEQCRKILEECSAPLSKPVYSIRSTHILFADEVIELAARGLIPPSPNEDLELNHRNTPLWRLDRAFKKHIYLTAQESILCEICNQQKEELFTLQKKLVTAEQDYEKLRGLHSKNEKTKTEANAIRQNIQKYKVRGARLEKLIEKIEIDILDRTREELDITEDNIRSLNITLTRESIISHEVNTIRRNSRLVAKLKEPFLPFVLSDNYKPEQGTTNDRSSLLEMLAEAEKNDPLIFSDKLIPSAKKIHRVLVRKSPFIIISPARGILGFIVEPRNGVENGRFILPGYFERSSMKYEVLISTLADFRFDNSKADAGVDLMNSDTLVAAYSTYRWNMRKKDKDTRQKAGVYMEENERTNWRRHYALYMKSAPDNGRQLFYKAPDLYEEIINKFIDLPEGGVALKR